MNTFDLLFFNVFNHYKLKYKRRANTIAQLYISILQISIIFLLGVFFDAFFRQLNVETMSPNKAWVLFSLTSFIIVFKNWIQFSGRKRNIINAKLSKRKTTRHNIWLLWLLPICCIILSFLLLNIL